MMGTHLSIVIPTYNSEAYIGRSIETVLSVVRQQRYVTEMIVVDDGSTDRTRTVLEPYRDQVRILANERNRGKGHAVRRGVLAAGGDHIIFVDADLPFGLEPISAVLRLLEQTADIVIGWRDPVQSVAVARPSWVRRLASGFFTVVVSRLIVPGVSDTQCGLKGFRRDAAQVLFSRSRINRFAFDVELMVLARARGLTLSRLPVTLVSTAPSSVRPVWDGLIAAKDLVLIFSYKLLGYYR
jgi:dolichyl-phosphate beta-glucosyltransferase